MEDKQKLTEDATGRCRRQKGSSIWNAWRKRLCGEAQNADRGWYLSSPISVLLNSIPELAYWLTIQCILSFKHIFSSAPNTFFLFIVSFLLNLLQFPFFFAFSTHTAYPFSSLSNFLVMCPMLSYPGNRDLELWITWELYLKFLIMLSISVNSTHNLRHSLSRQIKQKSHKKVTFHKLAKPTNGQVIPNSISASKPEIAPHNYFQKPQDQAVCV